MRPTHNRGIVGSIPMRPTILGNYMMKKFKTASRLPDGTVIRGLANAEEYEDAVTDVITAIQEDFKVDPKVVLCEVMGVLIDDAA